ncbi:hypothetical protein [Prosthecochloris sp.]|uniref:hypothetical protein n=1 Tax=Prosthecochloris sp. TaxID=290513 RepID=UPI0025DD17C6|nr:hypothetical protein [Prosthecochloris sp.]
MHKENSCCCQKPENLKRTPAECTPETIKQCHGEESSHTCVPEDQKEREKKDKEE